MSTPVEIDESPPGPRRFSSAHQAAPRAHLLSNGNYTVMITAAGSGYSRCRDLAVTRWREDSTCDGWGSYVFLRDVGGGEVWSAGYQPLGTEPDAYEVHFFEDRAQIIRHDGLLVTALEVLVSPTDDAEVRRVSLTNNGTRAREIDLTSYAELVLTAPDADAAHPAFAKMFVQTEFVAGAQVLLATRRHREPGEEPVWAAHLSVDDGATDAGVQYETDRLRFIGRGNELRHAAAIGAAGPLSNTSGTVLDPVFSLRRRVRVPPGGTVRVDFWTLLARSRDEALTLAGRYRDGAAFARTKASAGARAEAQLRSLGVDRRSAQQFQRVAGAVLYTQGSLRAAPEVLRANVLGPSALWAHGVSGDLPIVLVRIDDERDLGLVTALLRAHEYWRLRRLSVDLIVLNDRPASDAADLQAAIEGAIRATPRGGRDADGADRGRIFPLRGDRLTSADVDLLQTAARAVFVARHGALGIQLDELEAPDFEPVRRVARPAALAPGAAAEPRPALQFFNGLGGFSADGREYVTVLEPGRCTPAPWVNVIANADFGFQASTDGAGSTWSRNSRENQLTPWSNDPVSDPPAEVIYLRDDASGELWSATPQPIRRPGVSYTVTHGFGYSRFEHAADGIECSLLMFVPIEDPVKISRLTLVNRSNAVRRLSVASYADLVLGHQRSRTAPFTVTETEPETSALLARNPWRMDGQSRVVFMDLLGRQQSCTGDRAEFIGRHGSLSEPAAMVGDRALSNRVGGGLDPCAAMQTHFSLPPGGTAELVVLLGEAESSGAAVALIERYRTADLDAALRSVAEFWEGTLSAVKVRTPDRALDIMVNGWLLYQTLVCRVWARSGFYQASGAYGFRDQLQDVMALCVSRPELARAHILRAAARQFAAGDVQHWWLPTTGQGIQTRISDNRIWLPFVVSHYLDVTADVAVLAEPVPFLEGSPLKPDQAENFAAPPVAALTASLFEHCALALDSSLRVGSHGLPLFGTGDWNDGMNRVGAAGRGESVWLGWFLHTTLLKFATVADRHGDRARPALWRQHARSLQQAMEREAWDGGWYRRGYFDDGSPLGSVTSEECRIDAIAQSWAVISGAGDPARAALGMAAVDEQLVSRSDRLVKLFTPAFEHSKPDPGYVQAYPAGLRENGGQYTHAAMWTVLAFTLMGDGDRAAELFAMINPINHAITPSDVDRYKVEPYVVCADVYSTPAHVGRGGWTWYTGSAGWMYRTAVEGLLGVRRNGNVLRVDPCIPRGWSGFEVLVRHGATTYQVTVENPGGVSRGIHRAWLDDRELPDWKSGIALLDDGVTHRVRITLG